MLGKIYSNANPITTLPGATTTLPHYTITLCPEKEKKMNRLIKANQHQHHNTTVLAGTSSNISPLISGRRKNC